MLPQETIISRIRQLAQNDERIPAAMLYGSFTTGEADRFSDVDCVIFITNEYLEQFDRRDWISHIEPVALFYQNEFGNWATIFDNLVRAEFHFYPAEEMANKIAGWPSDLRFPTLEDTILVDKTGRLAHHLRPLVGPPLPRNSLMDAEYLQNSFLNWTLFGVNVLARGEFARASEILTLVQDTLLRMARMLDGTTQHWITPTRNVENELSHTAYIHFTTCTAAVNPSALWEAYKSAWKWGQLLLEKLAEQYQLPPLAALIQKLDHYFHQLQNA